MPVSTCIKGYTIQELKTLSEEEGNNWTRAYDKAYSTLCEWNTDFVGEGVDDQDGHVYWAVQGEEGSMFPVSGYTVTKVVEYEFASYRGTDHVAVTADIDKDVLLRRFQREKKLNPNEVRLLRSFYWWADVAEAPDGWFGHNRKSVGRVGSDEDTTDKRHELIEKLEELITDDIQERCGAATALLNDEYESLQEEEAIFDFAQANEYLFDEFGRPFNRGWYPQAPSVHAAAESAEEEEA